MTDPARRSLRRRALAAPCAAAGLTIVLAAFSSTTSNGLPPDPHLTPSTSAPMVPGMSSMPGGHHHPMPSRPAPGSLPMPGMPGMPGMDTMDGLAAEFNGYGMASGMDTLPAGKDIHYRFAITGPAGKPVKSFDVEQTQRLHFYAIRSDLTGFQHVHPTPASNGTWTAKLAALRPGMWRLYASFVPNSGPAKGQQFVLSRAVSVPGRAVAGVLPAPSAATTVDGYTITARGKLMANKASMLMVTITKDGRPLTNLQPYLNTYAHLTAFHEGDLAFAHLHPETEVDGDHGGPELLFHAELSRSGNWRMFLQFQTSGTVHTAALTVHVS